MRAATGRPWLRRRLEEVLHLLRPPLALFDARVLTRLAWDRLAGQVNAVYRRLRPFQRGTEDDSRLPRRTEANLEVTAAAGSRG